MWKSPPRSEIADGYVLGPVRFAVGLLLGWRALIDARERASGLHAVVISESLVPSNQLEGILLALRVCLAVMVVLSIRARPALALSGLLGVWLLLCDPAQVDPLRLLLSAFAILLSLTPCDRSWRLAASAEPIVRTGPFAAVRVCQILVAIAYLSSGASRLLDHDVVRVLAVQDPRSTLAKFIIVTEILLCVALWRRATRVVALWLGIWVHIALLCTEPVDAALLALLSMYGVFATPDYRARTIHYDPSRFRGKLTAHVVPLLDWLGRFEIKPWEPDEHEGHSIVVVRRDGEHVTGLRAFAMLTRCLPLLFPIWLPVMLLAAGTRHGDFSSRS